MHLIIERWGRGHEYRSEKETCFKPVLKKQINYNIIKLLTSKLESNRHTMTLNKQNNYELCKYLSDIRLSWVVFHLEMEGKLMPHNKQGCVDINIIDRLHYTTISPFLWLLAPPYNFFVMWGSCLILFGYTVIPMFQTSGIWKFLTNPLNLFPTHCPEGLGTGRVLQHIRGIDQETLHRWTSCPLAKLI